MLGVGLRARLRKSERDLLVGSRTVGGLVGGGGGEGGGGWAAIWKGVVWCGGWKEGLRMICGRVGVPQPRCWIEMYGNM